MPEPGRAPRVVTRGFAVVLAVAAGALGLVVGLLLALGYTALTADDADDAASPFRANDARVCSALVVVTTRLDGQPTVALRAGSFGNGDSQTWHQSAKLVQKQLLAGTSPQLRQPLARLAGQYDSTGDLVDRYADQSSYDDNAVGAQLRRTAAAEKSATAACYSVVRAAAKG